MADRMDATDDVLAEYDYFALKRRDHLDRYWEAKQLQDAARRKAKKESALAWRKQGAEALSSVMNRLQEIKFRVEPHHHFRKCMNFIQVYHQNSFAIDVECCWYKFRSAKMLHLIRQERFRRKYSLQVNLIAWKFAVHRELLEHFRRKNPFHAQFWYLVLPQPRKVLRVLFRYFLQFIPVQKKIRVQLQKKREAYRKARAKQDLIHRTQAACAFIPHCKSIQHYHPKGCGNCGVIFMGGMLAGAIPYVKSVGRDTGVPTLVTLEFEIQTLEQEDAVQTGIIQTIEKDLGDFESVVYMHVRLGLHAWWGIVLAWKRCVKNEKRLSSSAKKYRRKRMIRMQRELHIRIREPAPLTVEEYYDRYCDIPAALREQVDRLNERKRQRLLYYSQKFKRKLTLLVEEARERRYQEWLRLQAIPPPEKPIVLKALPDVKIGYKLVCLRPQCHMRKFLTKERFDIHMSIHAKEDARKKRFWEECAMKKQARGQEEMEFLEVLAEYRRETSSPPPVHEEAEANRKEGNDEGEEGWDGKLSITSVSHQSLSTTEEDGRSREEDPATGPASLASTPTPWLVLPHAAQLTQLFHAQYFYLELVSRAVGINAPAHVPLLPNAITRLGTQADNEGRLTAEPNSLGEEMLTRIAPVHCILRHEREDPIQGPSVITIRDNHTLWGTYILSGDTWAVKVPSQGRGKHNKVVNGTLICIAAQHKGEGKLSAVTASTACVVYRVQCRG